MSVDNEILIINIVSTINEAKHLIMSNVNTSKCEFELMDKWIVVKECSIKFTILFKGEIRSSEKVHSVSFSNLVEDETKYFFTGKINLI